MASDIDTDVAIIGAGPVGLFAVFELGMLKLSSVLIDALAEVGGQCAALYPEKPIYDIPAHPAIDAGELVAQLERQIAPFHAPRLLGRRVTGLAGGPGAFALTTDQGDTVRCKAVLIAAGAGAFGPNRPPLDGLAQYEAIGAVQYYVRRREDLRGKRVVIAGGGDSAVDWALALQRHRARRRRAPAGEIPRRAGKCGAARCGGAHAARSRWSSRISCMRCTVLTACCAMLRWRRCKARRGCCQPMCCCRSSGCRWISGRSRRGAWTRDLHHVKIDPATCQTSLPGVFAIGDVATYPGKLKLILQGFSEAAVAAHAIFGVAHPGEALHFEYSTTKGVPAG